MSGAADGWQVTGNTLTGTLPNTPNEFIGTLNNADWIIKTNNTERMRVKSNGQVVINNTTPFAGDVFSSFATGTDWAINGYNNGTGGAVYAENTGGGRAIFAISGGTVPTTASTNTNTTSGIAILGINSSTSAAIQGQSPSTGVLGLASANNGTGVLGIGTSTAIADGVTGYAGNSQAMGGVFLNTNANGTGIIVGGNNVANMWYNVNGSAGSFTGSNLVLTAYKDGGYVNNTGAGYFVANTTATAGVYVAYRDAGGTNYKIVSFGGFGSNVSTDVWGDKEGNSLKLMFCPEAPEILFQDVGTGQLVNGKAHIQLDPIFSNNIVVNEKHPLRVFIQLEDECNGVYVTNKTKEGFDVIELNGGKSNAKFAWFVVANRADFINPKTKELISKHEDIRFPNAPEPAPIIKRELNTKFNLCTQNEVRKR